MDSRLRRQRLPTKPDSAEGQPEVYRSHVGTKWAAHDAVDPRPARSVRGATEPGPESRHPKLGNLGSTTWNPTSPEPRRAGVPASPRFLFYTPESFPNDDSTTGENLCLSVGVKTRTNHPLAQAEPQSTGVVALAGVAGKRCVGDKTCFESRRLLPSASATARHNGRECAASHRHEGIGALDREEHSRDRSAAGNQAGRELPLHAP